MSLPITRGWGGRRCRRHGASVPNAGFSRSEALGKPGSLWDVHTFDITSIFTLPGTYTLALDGQEGIGDCTGLVLAIVDLKTVSARSRSTP